MEFTLPALLSLFFLLAVSSGVFFLAKRFKLPYTVALVAVGLFILVPLSYVPGFSFINAFTLTPELLFYIFLPVLIFESGYNINIRRFVENITTISTLAVISLLLSAAFIAVGLYVLLPLVGLEIPFMLCLLFAALISATDPVAVLALFKDVGAPRRLTLLFEGESIFNDGTAVALFLVVLEVALHGFHGATSVLEGITTFVMMVVGGALFGIVLGALFAKAIGGARGNEFVQVTLMLVLAHLSFILTDFISQNLVLFGHQIHLSAIIATALASMVLGNYGRAKVPPAAEEFVEKFWTQFAFFANSLVFILIGLIFTSLPIRLTDFIFPIVLAIVIVAVGRAFSVYPVSFVLNKLHFEAPISRAWQHLLAWGSLRGALAITMVLLIPDTLSLPGWTYAYTPKEFVLALTIGCIFMTLFIKATTIERLMRYLKVGTFSEQERLAHGESLCIVHQKALNRLDHFEEKGYISPALADTLRSEQNAYLSEDSNKYLSKIESEQSVQSERVLHMYAIGVEREMLKTLYTYGEVNEKVYRAVLDHLTNQHEALDEGVTNPDEGQPRPDVFEQMAHQVRKVISPRRAKQTLEDKYMYYRTHSVLARAVLHELTHMRREKDERAFGATAFEAVLARYEKYLTGSTAKMEGVREQDPKRIDREVERLVRHSILEVEEIALEHISKNSMITPKVYIAIRDELEEKAERLSDMDEIRDEVNR